MSTAPDTPQQPAPNRLYPWLLAAWIALVSAFAVWGLHGVPFHPDESTQLFMSQDFDLLWRDPLSMAWSEDKIGDPRQRYRELDAPLTRYILGLGRDLAGLPALPVDWEWGAGWEYNRQTGALPSENLLLAGRLTVTVLLPLSLYFIYRTGAMIQGPRMGLIAAVLLGSNALVLLHDRRAMAEAMLTLGTILALWSFMLGNRLPWLAGIGLALAFNAKQSTLALLPVGLLAVCWLPGEISGKRLKRITSACVQYLGIFMLLTFMLNPLWWKAPPRAILAGWQTRQALMHNQYADVARLAQQQALETPGERVLVLVANLYIVAPRFSEAANYTQETEPAEIAYMKIPAHNLLRGFSGGGIMLVVTLFGIVAAPLHLRHADNNRRRKLALLLLATLAQVAGLLYLIPLPWQRYVMPVVPLACLWAGFAIDTVIALRR